MSFCSTGLDRVWRLLLPSGLLELGEYRRGLKRLQVPARLAFRRSYRRALKSTHFDLLNAIVPQSPAVVVDVGANIGDWSAGIALLANPQRIIAFEPVPFVFSQLQANVRRFPQIECVQAAVGDHCGSVEMQVQQQHQLSSPLSLRPELWSIHGLVEERTAARVTVRLTTLDTELADVPEVSLLKLDVQGYEPKVIEGALRVLQRTRILISEVLYRSCYDGDARFDELHRLITTSAPFRMYGIAEPHCDPAGRPLWADAIYVNVQLLADT